MRKLLLLLLVAAASAQTTTPNLGLGLPAYNQVGWQSTINNNFVLLDNYLSGNAVLPSITANSLITGNLDNIIFVDGVRYITIAQALAAVPSTGASVVVVPSGYRETFTSHYNLGNGTTNAVILVLLNDVLLTCNVSDNTYCFNVHEASGIVGVRSQALDVSRGGGSIINLAPTANVANVVQTGDDPQGSITLDGFDIDNVNGGAVSNAFINIVNLNDSSTIRDISGAYFPHIGIHISATTGGTKSIGPLNIDNCYFSGVALAGARPLVIESDGSGATNNVNVMGGLYINPGSGLAAIEINGNGSTTGALQQILIAGVYTQQSTPSTAVTGIKIVDATGVTIQTSSFQVTDGTAGHTGITINQSGSGRTHAINVQNFRMDAAGGNIGLNNLITTTTVLNAAGSGNIPGYIYGGTAGSQPASAFIYDSDTKVQVAGSLSVSSLLLSATAPTISSGFGTSPSIVNSNGTAAFEINVGTGGSATSGVIGLPTAAVGWSCQVTDTNTNIVTRETAFTATTVTVTAASAWTASDNLLFNCGAF